MYSPDISRHSPKLYRVGLRLRLPMTRVADRLIAYGLERLEEVFRENPSPVANPVIRPDPAAGLVAAEEQAPYEAGKPALPDATHSLCETVSDLSILFISQPQRPENSRELIRLVIEWAGEFERRYAGETWADREYLEVVETFFDEQFRAWLETAPALARSVRVSAA